MGEPHVEGHRVSVRRIHALVEERGLSAGEVADKLGLDIADVYRALAYYHDYPGEMHDIERWREERTRDSLEKDGVGGPGDLSWSFGLLVFDDVFGFFYSFV